MKKELYKRILTSMVLLPIVIVSIFSEAIYFNILLIIVFFVASYEWFLINNKSYGSFFIGLLIIIAAIISAHILKGNNQDSQIYFLWLLTVVFFSDIGGYIFGKTIGGRKLTNISPSKTISGTVGSFIFSTFPIFIIYILNNLEMASFGHLVLSGKTFILSLIFSLVSQIGDISVSYFKRKNNLKDSGNILPGHGGLLDRIDGLIFLLIFSAILKFLKVI